MNTRTEDYPFNSELTLWRYAESWLSFPVTFLSLTWQDDQPIDCHLILQVDLERYQQINTQALFNLKPEIRGSGSAVDFQPDYSIQIEITLKPDRLPDLDTTTAEAAAHYLLKLSQEIPAHPLLQTENWLALSIKQQQETGEVGYTTLWATLNPAAIAAGTLSETEIAQALTHFFTDWTEANLGDLTEKAAAQILNEVGDFFNDLADTSIDAIAQITTSSDTILSQVITFFTEDDWSFTKLRGEPLLRLEFQGENGEWTCYAKTREEQQQFIFYSIYPIAASEDKRQTIAEFLTRANYGMTICNFELDYADGEIRYKTSIDVEGDRLTSALIQSIVYTNVTMMDAYLPGIQAVIQEGVSPVEAIRAIEQIDPIREQDA
ncbi:MAG: YbjN domain-containing protein [Phormidesmis sp. CAN_BIN44]|nr:YbjN domain-containing protein [Phormidesmis sp. CAN_BIN44]